MESKANTIQLISETIRPNIFESFDLDTFITSFLAKKALDIAFIGIRNAIKRINKNQSQIKIKKLDEKDSLKFISAHISDNIKWASNISFRDAFKAKSLNEIFVDLDLYIAPIKLRIDTQEKIPTIPIYEILSDTEKNIVLLGQPGAGKTTSIKKIFLETIYKNVEIYKVFSFPIIIRLKEINFDEKGNDLVLFREIFNTLGIFYNFEENVTKSAQEKIMVHFFKDFIERMDVLIILDGFDEINNSDLKKEIIKNLSLITNSTTNSKFILTSRSADFNVHIENTNEYEICPLNEKQIEDFVKKWLNESKESTKLLTQLRKSPYWDTTMRPLTLAHLCALYERNKSIPDKPKTVYKKIISLLLEEWSIQRSIERKSRYSQFEVDRKMEFLSKFAFILTTEYQLSTFTETILESIYKSICSDFELPKNDSLVVQKEIESHNGLIIQVGSTNYEFAHKSLLEYLVADYLVKLPYIINVTELLESLPNELAIMVAISSTPNLAYYQLMSELGSIALSTAFLKPFYTRLVIERPDFESNFLFALSNAAMVNLIIDQIKFLKDNRLTTSDSEKISEEEIGLKRQEEKEILEYYKECLEIIISLDRIEISKSSKNDLKKYYQFSIINPTKHSKLHIITNLGQVQLLMRKDKTISIHGLYIEIPDKLYLIESL